MGVLLRTTATTGTTGTTGAMDSDRFQRWKGTKIALKDIDLSGTCTDLVHSTAELDNAIQEHQAANIRLFMISY